MGDSRHPRRRMSLEEYLAFEDGSPIRHEYVAGEVYAMTGATVRHNIISHNIYRHLYPATRPRRCRVLVESVKLRVRDRIYYPDVLVACGRAAEVELIVEEPSLVVEVTSPSTHATDRREKLDAYMSLGSLQLYLIVDQRRKHVLVYSRQAGGEWARGEVEGDEGEIAIPFLDARLTMAEIYEDVTLPPLRVREGEAWDEKEWVEVE